MNDSVIPIGIYGWRKRFLYCLVLLLIVIILLNIALTVWILVVLKFNIDGMGGVRITEDGLQVQDSAEFLEAIYTKTIAADEELQIQSSKDIRLNAGGSTSILQMNSESISLTTDQFSVELNSRDGTSENVVLLSTSADGEVEFNASALHLGGSQGIFVDKGIVTREIMGLSEDGLIVEAFSSGINLSADGTIEMNSENGPIDIISSGNMTLSSTDGKVSISAGSLLLEGLPIAPPTDSDNTDETVYNLCVCSSGLLYRVQASPSNTHGCLISEDAIC